jgi:aconitate hydratase
MMGILPLVFTDGEDAASIGLDGSETFDIPLGNDLRPRQTLLVTATAGDGSIKTFSTVARVDTDIEVEYLRHGGILHYVLRRMVAD